MPEGQAPTGVPEAGGSDFLGLILGLAVPGKSDAFAGIPQGNTGGDPVETDPFREWLALASGVMTPGLAPTQPPPAGEADAARGAAGAALEGPVDALASAITSPTAPTAPDSPFEGARPAPGENGAESDEVFAKVDPAIPSDSPVPGVAGRRPAELGVVPGAGGGEMAPPEIMAPEPLHPRAERRLDDVALSALVPSSASTSTSAALTDLAAPGAKGAAFPPAAVPEVFERVQTMAAQGGGSLTLSLNPPELGGLEIQVTTRGNQVEIHMRPSTELAKSLLEGSAPELIRSLGAQDLVVSRLDVEVRHWASSAGTEFAAFGGGSGQPQGSFQGTGDGGHGSARSDSPMGGRWSVPATQVTQLTQSAIPAHEGRLNLRV